MTRVGVGRCKMMVVVWTHTDTPKSVIGARGSQRKLPPGRLNARKGAHREKIHKLNGKN